ncbi:isocitrate lyase/PEP mutase family protein [Hymenobacter terrenus]|uniref:isocitrate lyase/PEP mutase family protein n=1 Tax=Hymenobacter terrenus TaxID=1629124 RepID=UPI0006193C7C|nr:isocitrate lyase/phosphoenolpyruvate mutase family protein [Hymenobacter terrenus]
MTSFETFASLHQNSKPLLLGNIWDANSARLLEAAGYKAIGVSSQATAASFGYEDGEDMPFELLLQLAKRVAEVVHIPLTVDLEGGYSRTVAGITENIKKLHDVGVVGVNLEDSLVGATRQLQALDNFQQLLLGVAENLRRSNVQVFLNIRTDGFLLGLPAALAEAVNRINAYEHSGADGIFVPGITQADDIAHVVQATQLPVNVMCLPGLPDFAELMALGVKRISMGPFLFGQVSGYVSQLAQQVIADQHFAVILA